MNCVVLGLGSNRSYNEIESIELLQKAVIEMNKIMDKTICSSVYRTKPMYVENQDFFYNMVMLGIIHKEYDPYKTLQYIHSVEALLGRNRSKEIRFGPRSIDIDIEFFGETEMHTEDLEIPHPRLKERPFVLQPLLEILPKTSDTLKGEKLLKVQHDFKDYKSFDVELFMDNATFLLQVEKEVQNGNTDTRSS